MALLDQLFSQSPTFQNPAYATPERIKYMRDYATSLMANQPKAVNWQQGAANALDDLTSVMTQYGANKQEAGAKAANVAEYQPIITALMGGGGDAASPAAATPATPSAAPQAMGSPSTGADYATTLAKVESGGNPNAQASTSSALGPYQFTDGTWSDVAQKHPELGLTPDGRTDPGQAQRAMQAFTQDNASQLSAKGIPATDKNLYVAHLLGAGGGSSFLTNMQRDPNAPAYQYADPGAVKANQSLFFDKQGNPVNAQAFYNRVTAPFGEGQSAPPQAMAFNGAPQAPGSPAPMPSAPPSPVFGNVPGAPDIAAQGIPPQFAAKPPGTSPFGPPMPPQGALTPPVSPVPAPVPMAAGAAPVPVAPPSGMGAATSPPPAGTVLAPGAAQNRSGLSPDAVTKLIANPWTPDSVKSLIMQNIKPQTPKYVPLGDNAIMEEHTGKIVQSPVDKTSDLIRDYNFYKKDQEAKGQPVAAFNDWTIAQKQAASSNISLSTEKHGQEMLASKAIEGYDAANQASRESQKRIGIYDQMEKAAQAFTPGATAEAKLTAKRYLKDAGLIAGEDVPDAEVFHMLQQQLAIHAQPKGQGAVSNFEREMFSKSLPNMTMSPQGLSQAIGISRKLEQFDMNVAQIYRDSARANKGLPNYLDVQDKIAGLGNPLADSDYANIQRNATPPAGQPQAGGGGAPAPIKVASPDEARKLPKGTAIILPDGSPGVVP